MDAAEIIQLTESAGGHEPPEQSLRVDPWWLYRLDDLRPLLPCEVIEQLPYLSGEMVWGEAVIARIRELSGIERIGLGIREPARFAGEEKIDRLIQEHRLYKAEEVAEMIGQEDAQSFLREHGIKEVRKTDGLLWGGDIIEGVKHGKRRYDSPKYLGKARSSRSRREPSKDRQDREGVPCPQDEGELDFSALLR
jgi:hypothetical protein